MVNPNNRRRKNSAPTTTILVSFSLACQTCIKKSATKVAFTVAMPSATGALNRPRSSVAANTVSPVPSSNAKNTAKYIFKGDADECADMKSSRMPVNQIEQREKIDPDNIDEVPVETANLDGSVVFRCEASLPRHGQEPREDSETDDHVQRVQTRHYEIKGKKYLRVAGVCILAGMPGNRLVLETKRCSRDVMLNKLLAVLDALDSEEGE